jgi:hypothetical protein
MTWEKIFVKHLADTKIENVFNPYFDHCEVHDLNDAPSIRCRNLEAVLCIRQSIGVDSIWFGRDLGYRGGRRTGLALTDEVAMFSVGCQPGQELRIARATHGTPVAERTASVIWSVINRLRRPPMLWNAFPLHPHEPESPFTNRAHTTRERQETAWAIEALIEHFDKPRLIAIGNDASKALRDLGFEHETARHPSYGGQREFIETMERLHELEPRAAQPEPTLL